MKSPGEFRVVGTVIVALFIVSRPLAGGERPSASGVSWDRFQGLTEINPPASPAADSVIAIVGATLVDGRGGEPVPETAVVVHGDRITAVGPRREIRIPEAAEIVDGAGMTVLPGLLDAHLHVYSQDQRNRFERTAPLFLPRGVTSFRDPGRPDDIYDFVPAWKEPLSRCFVTGPHFDQEPPAYPQNCVIIETAEDARETVDRFVDQGGSVIKVYYRLPAELIRATCEQAHRRGVPVTAHLELIDADQAIRAGLDGVEHITSFGTCLADPDAAQAFRDAVDASNSARREWRYRLWAGLDLQSPRVEPLLQLIVDRGVFVSPTLNAFERRDGDKDVTLEQIRGFERMMEFVGRCHKAGALVVTSSHTISQYVPRGWAHQREMELLVESGLSPLEAITASTWHNALFLGCHERLGSLEAGKLADLILMAGNPHEDITAMYNIRRVMLNGRWIAETPDDVPETKQR